MPRDKQTEFHYNLALIIYVTLYEPKEALREPLDCLASARAAYRASRPTRHPPAVRVPPRPLRTSRKEAHPEYIRVILARGPNRLRLLHRASPRLVVISSQAVASFVSQHRRRPPPSWLVGSIPWSSSPVGRGSEEAVDSSPAGDTRQQQDNGSASGSINACRSPQSPLLEYSDASPCLFLSLLC